MKISVEISMYPLQDDYLGAIEFFLAEIKSQARDIEIRTSNMSTRLFGNFADVSGLLNSAMQNSMRVHGKIVFVCKYLQGDARQLDSSDFIDAA